VVQYGFGAKPTYAATVFRVRRESCSTPYPHARGIVGETTVLQDVDG